MVLYALILMPEFLAWPEKRIGLFPSPELAWEWVATHDSGRNDPYFYKVVPQIVYNDDDVGELDRSNG